MGMYWKASHCVYDCRYHIVWITKYRRECLNEKIQNRLKTILEGVCGEMRVKVIRMGIEEDHVHLYVTIPPVHPIPLVVKKLKGRSSKIIRKEFADYLKPFYWKPVLWAVGYFVCTIGQINHETISKYIEEQGVQEVEDECYEVKATDF